MYLYVTWPNEGWGRPGFLYFKLANHNDWPKHNIIFLKRKLILTTFTVIAQFLYEIIIDSHIYKFCVLDEDKNSIFLKKVLCIYNCQTIYKN